MPEVVQPAYPVPEVRSRTTSAQKFANGVMMGPTQRHDDVLSANPTLKPTRRDPEQRSLAKLLGLYAVMSAAFLAIWDADANVADAAADNLSSSRSNKSVISILGIGSLLTSISIITV